MVRGRLRYERRRLFSKTRRFSFVLRRGINIKIVNLAYSPHDSKQTCRLHARARVYMIANLTFYVALLTLLTPKLGEGSVRSAT